MEELITSEEESGKQVKRHTSLQKFGLLTKFLLPLVLTQLVPNMAEQAINRGITSIVSDDMVTLLASYGLAFYFLRLLLTAAVELRPVGIVLVHTRKDNRLMTVFATALGLVSAALLLIIGLTPLGTWLIRDVHRQSQEVSDVTCTIITYLCMIPLLEALASYHEGGLISQKMTIFAGIARITDFSMQVTFTIALLFTTTSTEPVLIPVFALYAGVIGRLILAVGFWYSLVRRRLLSGDIQKPLSAVRAFRFWFPLTLVRFSQAVSYPIIHILVSRDLSTTAGPEAAAKAVAVLTATYPCARVAFNWLNELRTIAPTFHRKTEHHEKFRIKMIALYSAFCTLVSLTVSLILYYIPGVAFFIMNSIIGLNEELTELSILPLKIFSLTGLCFGVRAHLSGILIMKKKTVYLTPSGILRVLSVTLFGTTLPRVGLSGAVLATTSCLLSFVVEVGFVVISCLILKYKHKLTVSSKESDAPLKFSEREAEREEDQQYCEREDLQYCGREDNSYSSVLSIHSAPVL